ncbi:MAG: resolvase [Synechococcus sp.]
MFSRSVDSALSASGSSVEGSADVDAVMARSESLVGIDDVQKSLNRSRASVYRYTNTDPRNLNPPFNPRKLNPEYRSDQKDPLLFHPNEVARFAKDVLRIKEVVVEVLNSPSTPTQQCLSAILDELRMIRAQLDGLQVSAGDPSDLAVRRERQDRPAA